MKLFKRTLTYIITAVMLLQLLPAAYAAQDDSVLTSLGHADTNTVTSIGSDREITLTVPFDYSGTSVDLAYGLNITYNTALYKSVITVPDGAAVVDGAAVNVMVVFNLVEETDDSPKSYTDYLVNVVRETAAAPEFSGVISLQNESPGSIPLAGPITSNYHKNDGPDLGEIRINGSNPEFGRLMYDGAVYTLSTKIDAASLHLLTFEATGTGIVSYGIDVFTVDDTVNVMGTAVLTISTYADPQITGAISLPLNKGASYIFKTSDFANRSQLYGMPITSVEITPTNAAFGKWYKGSTAFTATQTFLASEITSLSFAASATGEATFDWRVSTAAGTSAVGSGSINVVSPKITLNPITGAALLRGSTHSFSPAHFTYSPATVPLSFIKITTIPASADGYLYLTTALPKNDATGTIALAANTALVTGAVIPYAYLNYLRMATKGAGKAAQISFSWSATTDGTTKAAAWAEPASYTVPFVSAYPITYETDMNIPKAMLSSDFGTSFSSVTGLTLSYVTFTIPDKAAGALYLDYNVATAKGTAVTATSKYYTGKTPNLSKITFVPAKDFTGMTTISYTAYAENGKFVTGTINMYVRFNNGGTFSRVTDKNAPILLDSADFQSAFTAATGQQLSHIHFSLPSSTYGILYYDYVSSTDYAYAVPTSNTYNIYSAPYLSYISFVPAHDYTGPVTINYTGYSDNGTYTTGYAGKLVIYVVDSPAGIITYNVKDNGLISLNGDDFYNEFISVTGSVLSYITFTPPKAEFGSLYQEYSGDTQTGTKITATAKYYNGKSPDISDLTFVPAKDYTGTVVVPYKAYTSAGTAYEGKLKFIVGAGSSGTIAYTTQPGTALKMIPSSFTSAFYVNSGGLSLSYVTFTLPSATNGKLYYNYTSPSKYDSLATAGTKYYVNSAPYLSQLSFVPAANYTGSFTITYTGYASNGTSFTGKIKITVTGSAHGNVYYETTSLTPLRFRASDFSTAFTGDTGSSLSYVRFTPPYSSAGALYYNYTSSTGYTYPVSAYTNYYVSGSQLISDITFVPNSAFAGELAISYEAYDYNQKKYTGTVIIKVTSSDVGTVTVNTGKDTPVRLDSEDMNVAFIEKTGSSLYSAAFTLPAATYGTLYYGYVSAASYISKVAASTRYYRTVSPLLSDITFVPAAGFTGTVTIPYTGYTSGGTAYTGKIVVTVTKTTVSPFSDMRVNFDWAEEAVTYLYDYGVIEGSGDGKFRPSDNMARGDFTVMIARAFGLGYGGTDNFSDVDPNKYYADEIGAAKELGIILGSGGYFYPDSSLSRQDAMVIIYRALDVVGVPLSPGSIEDISSYPDADDISEYAVEAVSALINAGIITGSGGRIYPKDNITRAEMAVILYRILTM